ncbi:hypothetical protein CONCODRAFT_90607 [Conidiobolus coronatus NRRL 28638]|uniref:DNA polymeras-like protein subunit delta-2 n=1 Tax=Conidiobolus coronatus (strain ATCC 28846 / CBS 209.66 / NRRL 28638) TaxID=796925 RepID=A0A137P4U9_CONC2|nr:hypothetical protein CONCODRAFT_90607 [Conidiobolus coronatus NRRL 28638]|eukprot:KXN69961.1 hypothetical protein CONCODRAFT_90607 [Conidiobolus coronatus NRRL 28638]
MPSKPATSSPENFLNGKAESFKFKESYFEERDNIEYQTFNENYYKYINPDDFENQFLKLYNYRLEILKPICSELAKEKWSKKYENIASPDNVMGAQDDINYIVGTIYCKSALKPSIIDQVQENLYVVNPPKVDHYYCDSEEYSLEDDSGRIQLTCSDWNKFPPLITGVVAAILGRKIPDGSFDVEDIQFPEFPDQSPLNEVKPGQEKYIAIMSNLQLSPHKPIDPALEILFDYISGYATIDSDTTPFDSNIVGLFLSGNVFAYEDLEEAKKNYKKGELDHVDQLLANLSCHIPVYTMPGLEDPTSLTFPQDPLHRVLFPKASENPNFNSLTNPALAALDQTKILATSGQNIDDLIKYSPRLEALDWLEATLNYRHLGPNAPDTLFTLPFENQDPLIIEDCPHIYFASNQSKLSTKLVTGTNGQKVRLLTIPKFQSSFEVILVSLNSLNVKKIDLSIL